MANEDIAWVARYESILGSVGFTTSTFRDQHRIIVASGDLLSTLGLLKSQAGMDMLIDITAVDWLEREGAVDRFEVVYCLLNTETSERLVVLTYLNEPDLKLPTATGLWKAADWLEREVYDMFGIIFEGHPNFKRLLLPEGFASFPLRKDYPVQGRGERHNFPVITRAKS